MLGRRETTSPPSLTPVYGPILLPLGFPFPPVLFGHRRVSDFHTPSPFYLPSPHPRLFIGDLVTFTSVTTGKPLFPNPHSLPGAFIRPSPNFPGTVSTSLPLRLSRVVFLSSPSRPSEPPLGCTESRICLLPTDPTTTRRPTPRDPPRVRGTPQFLPGSVPRPPLRVPQTQRREPGFEGLEGTGLFT